MGTNMSINELVDEVDSSSRVYTKRLQPYRLIPPILNRQEIEGIERMRADRQESIDLLKSESKMSSIRAEEAVRSFMNLKLPKLPEVVI